MIFKSHVFDEPMLEFGDGGQHLPNAILVEEHEEKSNGQDEEDEDELFVRQQIHLIVEGGLRLSLFAIHLSRC